MDAAPPPTSPPAPNTTREAAPEPLGVARPAAQDLIAAPPPEEPFLEGPPDGKPRRPLRRSWASRWRVLQRLPMSLMLASLLAGLGIVQLTFQLGNMLYRTVTWTQETNATRSRLLELERDVTILKDAERSASDPLYLEQLARCQGFVGAKETVVVATSAPDTFGENCAARRLP